MELGDINRKKYNLGMVPKDGLEDWIKAQVDYSIGSCSTRIKDKLRVAYNLRNGVRNNAEFEYLWKAYGTEFPASMKFIPVLQTIFNSLIGQEMLSPLDPHIGINDKGTLDYIDDERKLAIIREIDLRIQKSMESSMAYSQKKYDNPNTVEKPKDFLSEEEIAKLKSFFTTDWKSPVEIDAQNVTDMLVEKLQLKAEFNTMFDDLVTAGQEYYQCKVQGQNRLPLFRVLNPLNIFYSKGPNTRFIKHLDRVVYKEMLPIVDVINLYGHKMLSDDLAKLTEKYEQTVASGVEVFDVRMLDVADKDVNSLQDYMKQGFCEVCYVEFKANRKIDITDKEYDEEILLDETKRKYKFISDRFEGVRIMNDIYVNLGKSKYIQRSIDCPSKCELTINGICYNDRNGEPYSMVLKTKDIQDKIDILHYHWENLVAMSGTKALPVNIPDIPHWLGNSPQERVMKWLGMVKQGVAPLDYSQDGIGAGKFNNYGDFDLTLNQSVSVITDMLGFLEDTALKITGQSRQSLGNIAVSDGKATTERAITQTSIVTQPLFTTHGLLKQEALTDLINATRMSFKDGLRGSFLDQDGRQKSFFTSSQFPLAELGVYLKNSAEESKKLEDFKALSMELVKNQMMDVEIAVNAFTVRSITELKQNIKEGIKAKKEDTTSQLQSQLEQSAKTIDALNKQIEGVKEGDLDIRKQEVQLKSMDIQRTNELKQEELDNKKRTDEEKLILEGKRVDLESMQIAYSNKSLEVKNS